MSIKWAVSIAEASARVPTGEHLCLIVHVKSQVSTLELVVAETVTVKVLPT
jgi:hypothetical protein